MKALDYQIEAIRKLVSASNSLLDLQGNHTIIFKSPTGSGKTIMIAEYLKTLVDFRHDSKSFSFIWTAPRKLHTQSKEKLEKHYIDSKALKCVTFGDLSDRMIGENEILFLNWESINREDNIYYRENEQDFYLEKVIDNTIDEGRIIVLIIDESHHTAGAENTQGLIALINARLTVEVSATPKISGDETVTVYRQKVVEEEMIKKGIVINPDFRDAILERLTNGDLKVISSAKESTNEFVIRNALEKREELKNHFVAEGNNVNPLMLIQLPNRRRKNIDIKEEIIDILRDTHSITIENDRLAIYLADDKENLAAITKNDSHVDVMIFKQAIALGWDCPRASILTLFRDWKNIVFSIQTVGRIMRMPELKHYSAEALNIGYIYTNLDDISIHQDISDGYATVFHSRRNDTYENIQLKSVHSVRQRGRTRLVPRFLEHFLSAANKIELKKKISTDIKEITQQLITDGVVTNPDEEFEHLNTEQPELFNPHSGGKVKRKLNEEEIQIQFDQFSLELLSPMYPETRSIKRINKSIYEFFKNEYFMEFQYASVYVQMVVLADANRQFFTDAVNLAKETYMDEIEEEAKDLSINDEWEVPSFVNYSVEFSHKAAALSVMDPFYNRIAASEIEKQFVGYLDNKSDEIDWWFKNGERDEIFFAVPYIDGDNNIPFYVDWVVKYKDGRVGLFDTKAGFTAEAAGKRAEGLAKYIKEQNKAGKNLVGGIIVEKNGTFWIQNKEKYEYSESDLPGTGWEVFS